MAGTVPPIAALTVEDRGPINTIVSIVLPTTSILMAAVRMTMSQQKFLRPEPDDIAYVLGLCFAIITSVLSHFCVRAGLGRRQVTLDEEQTEHYFKIFWITQLFGVIALALAKSSLVLLFKRIAPGHMEPHTGRWLMPTVAIYTLISLALVAFQCQLPRPWELSPTKCSTRGNVYYATTMLNLLTDAILALWILPMIWGLKMKAHTKNIVTLLFASRLAICAMDIGRMEIIHKALQSEDQTRSALLWVVMDQIVVHLSVAHATLPRIQTFISHLHLGDMGIHITQAETCRAASGARSSAAAFKNHSHQQVTEQAIGTNSNGQKARRGSHKAWNTLCTSLAGSLNRTPSLSEQPLTEQGIELSTTVYAGKSDNERRKSEYGRSATTSLSSEGANRESTGQQGGVRVQNDIHVVYN